MVKIKNVRISDLLTILLKLNLTHKAVNLRFDEESNTVEIEGIEIPKELDFPDDSSISEDNLNNY